MKGGWRLVVGAGWKEMGYDVRVGRDLMTFMMFMKDGGVLVYSGKKD